MHFFLGTEGTEFNYNSDLSGEVIIKVQNEVIRVPGDDLLEFVASYVRSRKISKLEDLDYTDVLGI